MTLITREEFINWLKTSRIVRDRYLEFHTFNGNSTHVTRIEKDGMLYDLADGFEISSDKEDYWYSVSLLYKAAGQEGEGI